MAASFSLFIVVPTGIRAALKAQQSFLWYINLTVIAGNQAEDGGYENDETRIDSTFLPLHWRY